LSRPILLGSLLVVLAASLFGTLGYVSREAVAAGLPPIAFVAWRALLASAALGVGTLWLSARGRAPLPDLRRLEAGRRWALLAAGLAGALLNVAIFVAFQRTTIALALITFYTFPAIVTLAAVRLYGERLTGTRLAALFLSSAGLLLVVIAPTLQTGELILDALGIALALFAAVCQAAFILLSARGYSPFASLHVATYVVFAAALVSIGLLAITNDLDALLTPLNTPGTWIWIVAGGLIGAAVPTTAMLAGLGLIGPTRTAILMTFEPVVGVALAGLLLAEQPGLLQLAGGAAVLIAAIVLQIGPRVPAEAEEAEVRLV
jgi:drug/metabolite transporter, DME family